MAQTVPRSDSVLQLRRESTAQQVASALRELIVTGGLPAARAPQGGRAGPTARGVTQHGPRGRPDSRQRRIGQARDAPRRVRGRADRGRRSRSVPRPAPGRADRGPRDRRLQGHRLASRRDRQPHRRGRVRRSIRDLRSRPRFPPPPRRADGQRTARRPVRRSRRRDAVLHRARDTGQVDASTLLKDHKAILTALERGNADTAAKRLQRHLDTGEQLLIDVLQAAPIAATAHS